MCLCPGDEIRIRRVIWDLHSADFCEDLKFEHYVALDRKFCTVNRGNRNFGSEVM